ncbi:MAG: serine hydrolase [bacterium]|nr:serine hydrolase [bacterium]
MTKFFLFLLVFFTFFLVVPESAGALTQVEKALLLQQIEILQQEIWLLQSLLSNMQLQQEVSAASYLAVNLSDNSVILSKNANQSYPIASITKLMNAVVASEHIEKSQTIQLTEEMLEPLGQSPSLFSGLNISAENLLKASLIQSVNDASEALTYFLGKEKFLSLTNEKAKELGMENTFFSDAHGLSPANRSTAADLAKLVAYIYEQHPEILQITKDNNFWLPDTTGRLLKFQNVNNFYPFSEFIGGKTGYLPQVKQTLASVFRVKEEPVAIILLYSDNRQADIFTILDQLKK